MGACSYALRWCCASQRGLQDSTGEEYWVLIQHAQCGSTMQAPMLMGGSMWAHACRTHLEVEAAPRVF